MEKPAKISIMRQKVLDQIAARKKANRKGGATPGDEKPANVKGKEK